MKFEEDFEVVLKQIHFDKSKGNGWYKFTFYSPKIHRRAALQTLQTLVTALLSVDRRFKTLF